MNIRELDLNLLPVLDALLRHRSVTKAAQELDMSQSSVSSALARLRVVFGDPLFVRSGKGVRATSRAEEVASTVEAVLGAVRDQLLCSEVFDPRQTRRSFNICLTDVGCYVLWPTLLNAVKSLSDRVSIRVLNLPREAVVSALDDGLIDVAIGSFPGLPNWIYQQRLYEREYVAITNVNHPLASRELTLTDFVESRQIIVRSASGIQEQIDTELRRLGMARNESMEMPSYLMLPPLLETDEYLAVVPGVLAEKFVRTAQVAVKKLPLELPRSAIYLYWHGRANRDGGGIWLRKAISAALSDRK